MTALPPPLSLYVHLPWCVRKCPYCDFNSHTAGPNIERDRYVDALLADLAAETGRAGGRELVSVFLGGGTPSLFSPDDIARIVDGIHAVFAVADDVEITMEANPGTVESGSPAGYRRAGVNRLSIGAQSLSADSLSKLGRIHSPGDVERSVREARDAGFDNLNLDIMHGLPGQDVAAALDDLEQAIALGPEHVSWYELTLEPNTVFHARPPEDLPDDDTIRTIEERGAELLRDSGYERYEVSAWSKPGRRCLHNLNYWQFGDYLGIGAGAHGKLTVDDTIYRSVRPANPLAYLVAMELPAPGRDLRELDDAERLFEYLLNALRLEDGFDESEFASRTGLDRKILETRAAPAVERGLIERESGGRWVPTALGRQFLNDLQSTFLP
ncbi:MAG: radical SAM family heme chaperone HemW [Pseudomonadota bacterium]